MKSDDDYDNEEAYDEESDGSESDSISEWNGSRISISTLYHYSLQQNDDLGVILESARVDLLEYLEKDEEYNWVFTHDLIKKQHRSLSVDLSKPYVDQNFKNFVTGE